ncbi:hypothetical protein MCUN1_000908 [Malassezia cuniculi]|uniref:Uncharacterized protein n=1 Tax=Malassezia cuniculi TaxID=948313 RepID=A0AAF0ETG9_9BASI|nr:hypothetical protein MCUN1_000908 [Malassezia cuniculi]
MRTSLQRASGIYRRVATTPAPQLVGELPSMRRPMRPFTTAALGFLFGFGAATLGSLYLLQKEYRAASASVLASSASLNAHAEHFTSYLDRIAAAEARVDQLSKLVVSRELIDQTNETARRMYSDMYEETLALRERVWRLGTSLADTENERLAFTQTPRSVWDAPPPPPSPAMRLL